MGQNNARLVDVNLIRQAGVVPNRDELIHSLEPDLKRKPTRAVNDAALYEAAKRDIRIIDEQNAITRFKWYNLPCNLTGEDLERLLYYKGQLAFFYMPETDEFYFMPYALDGGIDFYGRFNQIHPVPMSNGTDNAGDTPLSAALSRMKLKCLYGIPTKPLQPLEAMKCCVLLHDHCKQMSETIIPRQQLNDALCNYEAELLAYSRELAISGCGVRGLRVGSDDEAYNAKAANDSVRASALRGDVYVPIKGNMDFQELMEQGGNKIEEYFQAFQAADNFRLSTYGLGEGQMFEKKAHMLQTEADANQSNVGVILSADLSIRQNFCNIINNVFGLGVWCEPNEAYAGQDLNGDGNDYSSDTDGAQASKGEQVNE